MPRKASPATMLEDNKLDGFGQQVETALDHYADPQWLGEHSLLAAPFVLGQLIEQGKLVESALERGNALRVILQQSVQRIDGELSSIISEVYLHRNSDFKNSAIALRRNMSERTFYRWRQQAVFALAHEVYLLLLPALRVEQPPRAGMIGRAAALQNCLAALQAGQSIYISGPSGVGKTALGSEVQHAWNGRCFWYTVRPGISDRLANFLFSLGYFLRGLGAANTWRQLLADQGIVKLDRVLSILRFDLDQLAPLPLLICLDEADVLAPERSDHAQFLHVLDELGTLARVMLLGQRVVLETGFHLALAGFDDCELIEWLNSIGVPALIRRIGRRS